MIELVQEWAGLPVREVPIKGGLSHRISRVECDDGRRWLLRVLDPAVCVAGLGIPLEQEIANTALAASTGVGAGLVMRWNDHHVLLLEYLDGVTLDAAGVAANIEGIAEACKQLHAGPRFVNDFSIFDKLREFLRICRDNGLDRPAGYDDVLPLAWEIERAMPRVPTVPCHNDLLAENFILTPSGVRIVDYQLSGNNDPAFELGDIAAEADFDPDRTARLARAYGIDVARVRLFLIMSNLTWTLWFSVHHGLMARQADFDYAAEAADKFAQAVRDLNDPSFGQLIDKVRSDPP
ncbi:phosphotransferase [Nonomuraea sp. NPDC050663]|uniref:phosphotransferase n=1 Tax=Nonomuraea sp. NPDC050663 TaxID=3364370 RepID=UPI0037A5883E